MLKKDFWSAWKSSRRGAKAQRENDRNKSFTTRLDAFSPRLRDSSLINIQDEFVYEFNKKNPQNYDIVTKPEYFDFGANGSLDNYGKQTMWNLLGVDDYEQSIFNNPTEMKTLNLKPSPNSYNQ